MTCRISSALTVLLYCFFLVRILHGPFSVAVVVIHHYLERLLVVSFITMITFNRIIKTLFIIDFQKISLVPEHKVVGLFCFLTAITSCHYLLQEAVIRHLRGLNHYGRALGIYLGQVIWLQIISIQTKLCFIGKHFYATRGRGWHWRPLYISYNWSPTFLHLFKGSLKI